VEPTQLGPIDRASPYLQKRCVLKYKEDGVLNKNRMMGNVQKRNICTEYIMVEPLCMVWEESGSGCDLKGD
jgi:hypothetical protein